VLEDEEFYLNLPDWLFDPIPEGHVFKLNKVICTPSKLLDGGTRNIGVDGEQWTPGGEQREDNIHETSR
jgi:hypothetical protein